MQEFPLAGKYGQWHGKVVVIPVGEGNETFFDDLCDIEDSG